MDLCVGELQSREDLFEVRVWFHHQRMFEHRWRRRRRGGWPEDGRLSVLDILFVARQGKRALHVCLSPKGRGSLRWPMLAVCAHAPCARPLTVSGLTICWREQVWISYRVLRAPHVPRIDEAQGLKPSQKRAQGLMALPIRMLASKATIADAPATAAELRSAFSLQTCSALGCPAPRRSDGWSDSWSARALPHLKFKPA